MGNKVEYLNKNYSTTKLCYKLLDDKYLDGNGKIKEEYKFKLNFPEFGIVDSKIPAKEGDKFDTYLFLPEGEGRKEEGGFRTKGYFKFSYENKDGKWWIVEDNKFIKEVELDENIVKDYEKLPLISIITVVFNGEKYLEETIQSVINQTYPNVEYIIIDGGSTDRTLDIIKKHEDRIDYWVSEKDKGIYDAMNKGIKLAMGEVIGLINADDYYEKNILKYITENINNGEVFYGDMYLIYESKDIKETRIASSWKLYFGMSLNHPATFIKKEVYKNYLFNTSYKIAADYDLLLQLKLAGKKFIKINEILAYMKDGGESVNYSSITQLEEKMIKKNNLKYFYFLSETILYIWSKFNKYV